MAKKFWEHEGFDIALFTAVFNGVYDVYYQSGNDGREYGAMVNRGDGILNDKGDEPVVKAFCEYRQDYVTSDREAAALAVTYGIFEKRYKNSTTMSNNESAIMYEMQVRVTYKDGKSHLTTAKGAADILNECLRDCGIERDAKAAALRAYTEAAVRSYREQSRLDYQAGVITISNE